MTLIHDTQRRCSVATRRELELRGGVVSSRSGSCALGPYDFCIQCGRERSSIRSKNHCGVIRPSVVNSEHALKGWIRRRCFVRDYGWMPRDDLCRRDAKLRFNERSTRREAPALLTGQRQRVADVREMHGAVRRDIQGR